MNQISNIERRIRTYEEFGDHRTGRDADNETWSWLMSELWHMGIGNADGQLFRFPRVEIHEAALLSPVSIGGWDVEGVPLYDCSFTDHEGVSGVLRRDNGPGIVIWELGPDRPERLTPEIYPALESAKLAGAVGVVLIMGDPDGKPVLRNAERSLDPIDLPVLQIASDGDTEWIEDYIGTEADLFLDGGRVDAPAYNVVGSVPGTDPDAAPVVLMTPKSGWYTCAAERGGGIAVWLEIAGRIAANPGRRTLNLVASSGHELHHLGLDHYIRELGDDVHNVHAWMHLGASIGAKNGTPRYAASDDQLFRVASEALSALGIEREAFPVGSTGYGEARNIGEINGRFVSFLGGHPYFHSPLDTYDRCVDPESVALHIEATERIVRYMLN